MFFSLFPLQTVSAAPQGLWTTPAGLTRELEPVSVNQVSLVTTVTPVLQDSMDSTVRVCGELN